MKNVTSYDPHALLTIAELATRFSLPESTARYYCKRFLDYLPHTGHGKRRRYRGSAVAVFSVILDEMRKSKNAMAVEAVLSNKFPKNIEVLPSKTQAQQQNNNLPTHAAFSAISEVDAGRFFALIEQQTAAMQSIAAALDDISKREGLISQLEQTLKARTNEVELLRKEVEQVKTLQSESEKLHQQDLDQMRKWLGRIATERADGK